MRAYIDREFKEESQKRLEFNDQHYRYLPQNLKYMLEEPPIRYDIYPKFESQTGIDPAKMLDFLGEISSQLKPMIVSQNLEEPEAKRERLLSGSIVHDDYMPKQQEKRQDSIDDNFVSVDEEGFQELRQYQKDQQAKFNVSKTSTKTSDEGSKM